MAKKAISKKKSKRLIYIYAMASFFHDIGANIIYPIWPFYITGILKLDFLFLGLIDGIGEFFLYFSKAFSGLFSDYLRKRKRFIWMGYFLPGIARIGFALSSTWPALAIFKSLDRAGKIRDTPRDAIITEVTIKSHRGRSFGFLELFDKLGAVLGVVLLIWLVWYYRELLNYINTFIFAGFFSIISAGIILLYSTDHFKLKRKYSKGSKATKFIEPLKHNLKRPNYLVFLIIGALISLATFSYSFILILIRPIISNVALFDFELNSSSYVIMISAIAFLLYNISASVSSYSFGNFADFFGRKNSILAANFMYFISSLLLLLSLTVVTFNIRMISLLLAMIMYGVYIGALNTVLITHVSEVSNPNYKASGIGFFYFVFGLFAFCASFIAGYLSSFYSYQHMVYFSMIALGLASLFTWIKMEV